MELSSLSIRKTYSYESEKGFVGTLTCTSPTTETKINLSDEACRQILIVAGAGIKQAAAETARFLESEATRLEKADVPLLAQGFQESTESDHPF